MSKKKKHVVKNTAKKNRSTTNYTRNYPKSYRKNGKKAPKAVDALWAISLIILGMAGIFFGISAILEWMLPIWIFRIVGVVGVVALPFLVVTTVIKLKNT